MTHRTDRELLKLAAKAAGIAHVTPMMIELGKWNPLEDDRDNAELEAELSFDVLWYPCWVVNVGGKFEDFSCHGNDKNKARRRASVRAAAEIGAKL